MKEYLLAFKEYATFTGRATRKEYWMFVLFNILFSLLFLGLDYLLFSTTNEYTDKTISYPILQGIYALVLFLPSLAVQVRRLHDVNKSGWMLLVGLIPIVGTIWLLVLFFTKGDEGANRYGEPSGALPKKDIVTP